MRYNIQRLYESRSLPLEDNSCILGALSGNELNLLICKPRLYDSTSPDDTRILDVYDYTVSDAPHDSSDQDDDVVLGSWVGVYEIPLEEAYAEDIDFERYTILRCSYDENGNPFCPKEREEREREDREREDREREEREEREDRSVQRGQGPARKWTMKRRRRYLTESRWLSRFLSEELMMHESESMMFELTNVSLLNEADSLFLCVKNIIVAMEDVSDCGVTHVMETCADMREKIWSMVDEDMYRRHESAYAERFGVLQAADATLREINQEARDIHGKISTVASQSMPRCERLAMIDRAKLLKTRHQLLKRQRDVYRADVAEYGHMKGVRTYKRFKDTIADGTCMLHVEFISMLERAYGFKVILVDKAAIESGDFDNAIQCGSQSASWLSSSSFFEPRYYALIATSRRGYANVVYDREFVFIADEIPEVIVDAIVDRIGEGRGVGFSSIPYFVKAVAARSNKQFPLRHVTSARGSHSQVALLLHARAPRNHVLAGRWFGESMPFEHVLDYFALNEVHAGWRCILSNDWVMLDAPLIISEGGDRTGRYASVTHYLMSHEYPDLIAGPVGLERSIFELADSNGPSLDASRTIAGARDAVRKARHGRELASLSYGDEVEVRALSAKFLNDAASGDMAQMLLATNDSTLYTYERGRCPWPQYNLMYVRDLLRQSDRTRGAALTSRTARRRFASKGAFYAGHKAL